ncbi:predicted protein [Sclerotinia sclerotiorum 1980 UF-70]|uniref:Uncharacterized protein n=1 Tax=Sclerotinia sclerotiorum (strain ATCC 18683 / 1980 / Ss-1) TaxID=665079 RepID=A7F0P1_SCLS1|nr:predicted protein [Sclerotinia sclerotiorum 1980 UF-70]EDN95283.1 predicted protein [Sclerotinia sclerotiorum 1980 UF-70]
MGLWVEAENERPIIDFCGSWWLPNVDVLAKYISSRCDFVDEEVEVDDHYRDDKSLLGMAPTTSFS